jgi:recombination associated protein RdgC
MSTWFRNLQLYSISPEWARTPGDIEEALAKHPLMPCGALAMESHGWVQPHEESGLVFARNRQVMLSLGMQQRLLPASVINQATKLKARELERQQGFKVGRKQLRDLKDRVADELRPRAFVKEKTVRLWIDLRHNRLAVDTSSPKVADHVTSMLRTDLGELPIVPLTTQTGPGGAMTNWLMSGAAPGRQGFAINQDCELVGGGAEEATVRYARHDLHGAEVRSLIQGGKQVRQLGLVWRDRLSLVLTDKLVIKRIRPEAMDSADADAGMPENVAERFEADFALMTGEFSGLLNDLVEALGGAQA